MSRVLIAVIMTSRVVLRNRGVDPYNITCIVLLQSKCPQTLALNAMKARARSPRMLILCCYVVNHRIRVHSTSRF